MTEKSSTKTGDANITIIRVVTLLLCASSALCVLLGFASILANLEYTQEALVIRGKEAPVAAEVAPIPEAPVPASPEPPPVKIPDISFPAPAAILATDESQTTQEESHLMHITTGETLTFSCGEGAVTIHFKDGGVEYFNCDPQSSGKAFWESVSAAFPAFKESIRKEKR